MTLVVTWTLRYKCTRRTIKASCDQCNIIMKQSVLGTTDFLQKIIQFNVNEPDTKAHLR